MATIAVFAVEAGRRRERPQWRSPYTWPALLFLAAGVVSVLVAPDLLKALGLFRAYLLEPMAFFIVLGAVLRTREAALLVLAGLGVAGLVAGLANMGVVIPAILQHRLNLGGVPPVAIYQTPNALALFLGPLIAVAGAIAAFEGDRRLRLAAAGFLVVALAAIGLSLSRGGLLVVLAVAFALALVHPRRRLLVPAALLAGALVAVLPPIRSRLSHEFNFADPLNTLASRLRLWGATLRMLRDHPVFGSGLSGFRQAIEPYRSGNYTEDLIYPHNIVLNFWTETGLLGLAAFAWLFVQAARVSLDGWRRGAAAWRPLQLGVALALLAVLVHGMLDVPYWKNDLSLEFWALLGVSWAGSRSGLA